MFGFFDEDDEEETTAAPAEPALPMASSNKPLDPTVRAALEQKYFAKPDLSAAKEKAAGNRRTASIVEGLGTMLGGKVDGGFFDGMRARADKSVDRAAAEDEKSRGLYKYLIDSDDKLKTLAQREAQHKADLTSRETLAREGRAAEDARQKAGFEHAIRLKGMEKRPGESTGSWVASSQVDENGNALLFNNKTGEFKVGPKAGARPGDTTKAEALAEKREKEDELIAIPDYDRTPGMRVKPDDASKLRAAKGTVDTLTKNLEQFGSLVKGQGTFEFGGEGGGQAKSLHTTIMMDLKNLYELGVLNGPDLAILSSQIGDPESLGAMFTRDKTALAGLGKTLETVKQRFKDRMAASGYAAQAQPPVGGETPAVAAEMPAEGQKIPDEAFGGVSMMPEDAAIATKGGKTVVKKQYSPSQKKTKIIYNDGTEEIVDGQR